MITFTYIENHCEKRNAVKLENTTFGHVYCWFKENYPKGKLLGFTVYDNKEDWLDMQLFLLASIK
ncbi:MAG TPA: hypothetical protein PLF17_09765 [Chitinophagaceae bacterium]|nr:hypothetical protein [Chitinophagaceae bacterium]